jgi:hypothetical protein
VPLKLVHGRRCAWGAAAPCGSLARRARSSGWITRAALLLRAWQQINGIECGSHPVVTSCMGVFRIECSSHTSHNSRVSLTIAASTFITPTHAHPHMNISLALPLPTPSHVQRRPRAAPTRTPRRRVIFSESSTMQAASCNVGGAAGSCRRQPAFQPAWRAAHLAARRCRRAAAVSPASAAAASPAVPAAAPSPPRRLLYDGVALDMDGTLTSCVIDFVDMRQRTGERCCSTHAHGARARHSC